MLWLNHKEALQALTRFATSFDPTERGRFVVLAAKVLVMVRNGWGGVEVAEGFLDAPVYGFTEHEAVTTSTDFGAIAADVVPFTSDDTYAVPGAGGFYLRNPMQVMFGHGRPPLANWYYDSEWG